MIDLDVALEQVHPRIPARTLGRSERVPSDSECMGTAAHRRGAGHAP
jgi:hypothetical protein